MGKGRSNHGRAAAAQRWTLDQQAAALRLYDDDDPPGFCKNDPPGFGINAASKTTSGSPHRVEQRLGEKGRNIPQRKPEAATAAAAPWATVKGAHSKEHTSRSADELTASAKSFQKETYNKHGAWAPGVESLIIGSKDSTSDAAPSEPKEPSKFTRGDWGPEKQVRDIPEYDEEKLKEAAQMMYYKGVGLRDAANKCNVAATDLKYFYNHHADQYLLEEDGEDLDDFDY